MVAHRTAALWLRTLGRFMNNPVRVSYSKIKTFVGLFSLFTLLFLFSSPYFTWADSREQRLKRGKKAYREYCWACHGKKGLGDGEGAIISGIPPTDISDKAYMSLISEQELFLKIKFGEDRFPHLQMPGVEYQISDKTIWKLIEYMKTLQVDKGPLRVLTPQEKAKRFQNPIERGRIYYLRYCSVCHGATGDGKGWAARTVEGDPVAHNDPIIMNKFTRQEIFKHVKGIKNKQDRSMPIFGRTITSNIVKVIAAYTKTLSENIN